MRRCGGDVPAASGETWLREPAFGVVTVERLRLEAVSDDLEQQLAAVATPEAHPVS